jgi:hypothetical protein
MHAVAESSSDLGKIWQVEEHGVVCASRSKRAVSGCDAGDDRLCHVQFQPRCIISLKVPVQRLQGEQEVRA